MNDFYSWNKTLCKELCCEMEKFECKPNAETLHNVKTLAKTILYMQELEAADAMRDYLEDEHGYDSRTGDFRKRTWDKPYGVYNSIDGRPIQRRQRMERDGMTNKDYNGNDYDRDRDKRWYPMMGDNDYRMEDDRMTYMRGVYNHVDRDMKPLTDEEYKKWVSSMENSDGSTGGIWSEQETSAVAKKLGIDFKEFTPIEFWVAMNMQYSDLCMTMEKNGMDKPEVYAEIAKDWLLDDDTLKGGKKLSAYYHSVVEK